MLFSIIIPSYNQGKYLQENFDSLILQDVDIEIIVIDGGSTDNSIKIIKQYEDKIKYWQSEKDRGTYDAINIGLKHCTGEYIGVVNSDDFLLKDSLKKIQQFILNKDYPNWITGGIHVINENSNIKAKNTPISPNKIGDYTFINGCWIYHPCTFIKKEIYQEIGTFASVDVVDLDYWLRMEKAGYKPMIIQDYLAALRFHSDCKSFDYINISEEIKYTITNFATDNNLSHLDAFKEKVKALDIELLKFRNYKNRSENKIAICIIELFKFLKAHPKSIIEKWFLGLIKRCIIGFKKDEFNPVKYLED